MKTAYCKISIGSFKQKVYIKKDLFSIPEQIEVPIHFLPILFSSEEGLGTVYLNGAPKNFLERIQQETKERQILNNNKNNIVFIYSQF